MTNLTISADPGDVEFLKMKGYSASRIFRYAVYRIKAGEVLDVRNVETLDSLVQYIAELLAKIEKLQKANYEMGRTRDVAVQKTTADSTATNG